MMRKEPQCGIKTGGLHPTALLVGKIESRAAWLPPRLREPDHTHSVPICSHFTLLSHQLPSPPYGRPQGERWVKDRWVAEKEDRASWLCSRVQSSHTVSLTHTGVDLMPQAGR